MPTILMMYFRLDKALEDFEGDLLRPATIFNKITTEGQRLNPADMV